MLNKKFLSATFIALAITGSVAFEHHDPNSKCEGI